VAVSGQIDSTLTVRQVGTRAMQLLSVLGLGETPTGDESDHFMESLNLMLKSWQAEGVNLWRQTNITFDTVVGQATYTLTPRPVDVQSASINYGYDREMQRWELGEYDQIPNKATLGYPTCYYVDRQRDDVTMTLWPVPNSVQTVTYTAARVIDDVTDLEETLDVPQAWLECVVYNLAVALYPVLGGQRIEIIGAKAATLYNKMLDFDRPSSIFMGSYG